MVAVVVVQSLNPSPPSIPDIPAGDKLVHLFFFTFRYFQVIHQEYLRLRAAMRIRCFQPGTNGHTYRMLAYLLGMLLVRSYDRGQRLWTVDPAVGEPDLVAEHIFYLGTPQQLQQRSTEVSAPLVAPRVLPQAGDPEAWRAYVAAGWPLCLRVPPTWWVETRGDPDTEEVWEVAVANFEPAEQDGVVALTGDLVEVSFAYHHYPTEDAPPSLDQMRGRGRESLVARRSDRRRPPVVWSHSPPPR